MVGGVAVLTETVQAWGCSANYASFSDAIAAKMSARPLLLLLLLLLLLSTTPSPSLSSSISSPFSPPASIAAVALGSKLCTSTRHP